jgi:hypothetical protein
MPRARLIIYAIVAASLAGNLAFGARWLNHRHAKAAHVSLGSYGGPVTADGRTRVDCRLPTSGKRGTAVLLILGQSNAANTLNAFSDPGPDVFNFSLYDGKCYLAREPLLGASNAGGNFATLLARRLVERHYDRVILAPISVGGTYIQQWMPTGEHNARITIAIERMREAGIEPTHVLWHQGEGNRTDDPTFYRRAFLGVLSTIRRDGVKAPVYVAQTTICRSEKGEAIREAQRSLVAPASGVMLGPDTDQLSNEFRYDGCHFDIEGGSRVADMWLAAIVGRNVAAGGHF